jgi:hypothetical protein
MLLAALAWPMLCSGAILWRVPATRDKPRIVSFASFTMATESRSASGIRPRELWRGSSGFGLQITMTDLAGVNLLQFPANLPQTASGLFS